MTGDELAEVRYEQLEDFGDELVRLMKRAILNAGGDYEGFRRYLSHKEAFGHLYDALPFAFEGVEEVNYKGCS